MIVRQIKEKEWENVCRQLAALGRAAPLSLQIDWELSCNGVVFVLKIQPERNHKLVVLQATGVYPDAKTPDGKAYRVIDDNLLLSALLEIVLHQIAVKGPIDEKKTAG